MNIVKGIGKGIVVAAVITYLAFDLAYLCLFIYHLGILEVFSELLGWLMLSTGYLAFNWLLRYFRNS